MQANKPSRKTGRRAAGKQVINQTRHEAHCTVCAHPERAEIEQAFVNWVSPVRIASQFTVSYGCGVPPSAASRKDGSPLHAQTALRAVLN